MAPPVSRQLRAIILGTVREAALKGQGWGGALSSHLGCSSCPQSKREFSARLGRCSKDTNPGLKTLCSRQQSRKHLCLCLRFLSAPLPPQSLVILCPGPWALAFPCPPWAPTGHPNPPTRGWPSGCSRLGHQSPVQPAVGSTLTLGGGCRPCCGQGPGPRGHSYSPL